MSDTAKAPAADDPAERAEVDRLCTAHHRYALGVSRRFSQLYPALADDFESAAGLALLKAARTRHTFNGEFKQLVSIQVSSACQEVVEGERGRPDSTLNVESVADFRAGNSAPAGLSLETADLLGTLSEAHREVVTRHFLGGETYVEIAADKGTSEQAVRQMAERALAKLRAKVEGAARD